MMFFGKSALPTLAFLLLTLSEIVSAAKPLFGTASWYYPGIGACGGWNVNSDKTVALPSLSYGPGSHCGRDVMIHCQGKKVTAKVVDLCPSCGLNGIELSAAAFQVLAPLEQGVIQVVWEYV